MTKVCIVCREDVLIPQVGDDLPFMYSMYQQTDVIVMQNGRTESCPNSPIRYVCESCRQLYRGDWMTVGEPKLQEDSMFKMEKEKK